MFLITFIFIYLAILFVVNLCMYYSTTDFIDFIDLDFEYEETPEENIILNDGRISNYV